MKDELTELKLIKEMLMITLIDLSSDYSKELILKQIQRLKIIIKRKEKKR